jgi:hypothetical protein
MNFSPDLKAQLYAAIAAGNTKAAWSMLLNDLLGPNERGPLGATECRNVALAGGGMGRIVST